ncbi:hypothetical protein Afil01_23290 [Actinorhabdospora filicis]|uniref:Uncharacterized protein n=1 Tax=Actinorhabdospora filicis TaxID=1785913 RepID=A0A9W6SKK0_9ACTN|nr:hypothetical protein [Actinorhabdospora filicis]GLZ77522.1 hypothetical protein Afil01_23290 [Actinorhabdospora filicis]
MGIEINFDSRTSAQRVQEVLCARYGIDPALLYVGDLGEYSGPRLIAYVTPAPEGERYFACVLEGGPEFDEAIGGLTELQLATLLCKELDTRALIDDGGGAATSWILVTADGWHGRVIVDDDRLDDEFVILEALQPVPSAPEIPVVEPPDWQKGWYKDGKIPTSGFDPDDWRKPSEAAG